MELLLIYTVVQNWFIRSSVSAEEEKDFSYQQQKQRASFDWPPELEYAKEPKESTLFQKGCCGLGHRTSRLMKGYTYALSRGKQTVVNWGPCVGTEVKNIYTEFFDDVPYELIGYDETKTVFYSKKCPDNGVCANRSQWETLAQTKTANPEFDDDIYIDNEPMLNWFPPDSKIQSGTRISFPAVQAKEWHLEFLHKDIAPYASRFAALQIKYLKPRWRQALEQFKNDEKFSHHATRIIGIHFRIGNGEHFSRKPQNITQLLLYTASALRQMSTFFGFIGNQRRSLRVFVATDDFTVLDLLRKLAPDFDFFSREQWRPPPGAGVVFSSWTLKSRFIQDPNANQIAKNTLTDSAESCVSKSADMLIDSFLLGYADAMLLTVPSTFSVLPKAMAFARHVPFCAFLYGTSMKKLPRFHLYLADDTSIPLTCFRQVAGHLTAIHIDVPSGAFTATTKRQSAFLSSVTSEGGADIYGYDASEPRKNRRGSHFR
uniref:GT23 domain-containing protein n=1 Tax=Aureoumbra lagunensis TaxID=44058 RepID=A0A7S3JQY2_9STRA|mmetsp:Transcript_3404/g.5213  ORF Transcript_3404/g.5213 Transcript_3404/m.5213 type:complete len:487 (-) Transcript_3404:194-1654(-)